MSYSFSKYFSKAPLNRFYFDLGPLTLHSVKFQPPFLQPQSVFPWLSWKLLTILFSASWILTEMTGSAAFFLSVDMEKSAALHTALFFHVLSCIPHSFGQLYFFFFFFFPVFLALSADFLPYWDSYRALEQGMGSFYCPSDFLVRTKWVGKYIYIFDANSASLRWILLRELLFPISCFFQIDVRRLNMMRAGEVRWSQSRSVHYFYLRLLCLVFLLIFYQGDKKGK